MVRLIRDGFWFGFTHCSHCESLCFVILSPNCVGCVSGSFLTGWLIEATLHWTYWTTHIQISAKWICLKIGYTMVYQYIYKTCNATGKLINHYSPQDFECTKVAVFWLVAFSNPRNGTMMLADCRTHFFQWVAQPPTSMYLSILV